MSLKTDYKDDIYEGSRRWRMTPNEDGTYNISDATSYTQKGDKFGQNDMNAITVEVNRMTNEYEVTLPASGWSSAAPYTQTVAVPGLKETDKVQLMSAIKTDTAVATADIWDKMGALVKAGKALDGQAMFVCPKKKPTSDFNVILVGVSTNE